MFKPVSGTGISWSSTSRSAMVKMWSNDDGCFEIIPLAFTVCWITVEILKRNMGENKPTVPIERLWKHSNTIISLREKCCFPINLLFLCQFPTCRELTEWVKVVLKMTLPSAELADLDTKSLLAMVTKEDIQRVMDEKNIELARMGNMLENK